MPEEKNITQESSGLNLYEKLLRIADMAGVLQRNKEGFNYKYVPELEIQAKVTAGMQKYGVMLYPSLVPGTFEVIPYQYQKEKTRKEGYGKDQKIIPYMSSVNEIIVKAEVDYTWVNVENPSEQLVCHWAYAGQMEDVSQAFGAGTTYGNRYFLMKALQLATSEDDPDNYRSKQAAAASYEDEKAEKERAETFAKAKKEVVDLGTELIKKGVPKTKISEVVARHNNGNGNPSSVTDIAVFAIIKDEFAKLAKDSKSSAATQSSHATNQTTGTRKRTSKEETK